MSTPLAIALVSPHAWPPSDDLTWRIDAEARALAARGHRVTILTPARGRELLDEGRRALARLRAGDNDVALAAPGQVRVLPLGRALPGARRRLGGPIDLSVALQDVLSRVPYDVVHLHEPLAPTPALAALRHARGVTAATFHRTQQVAGVAFVRPFVERAVGRLDVWTAASDAVRRMVTELFGHDATVVRDAVDTARFTPAPIGNGPPNVVIVGRGADRAGIRFGLSAVRAAMAPLGAVTVLGPADAHWRTVAAIPKLMRPRVTAVADWGPASRAEIFAAGGVALFTTPEDLDGAVVGEAMAAGMSVIVPRCPDAEGLIRDGADGLVLPPFSRERWAGMLDELAGAPERRAALRDAGTRSAAERSLDAVGARLEELYRAAARPAPSAVQDGADRVIADLRVQPGPGLAPRQLVDACLARGVRIVAVIGDDVTPGAETARLAGDRLDVVVGQQIHTGEGDLVGLFLSETVAHGLTCEATVDAVHAQGGLVMAPHPVWGEPPPAELLHRLRDRIDCNEVMIGPASTLRAGIAIEEARLLQRFGLRVVAGSGATAPEDIGSAHLRMRRSRSPAEFVAALADADPVQRRRGLRVRGGRERRRPGTPQT